MLNTTDIHIYREILICLLNTGAIYADSKIFGYYYPTIITSMILIRLVTALGKGVVLGFISPPILKAMSKITGNGRTRSAAERKAVASSVAPAEPEVNAQPAEPVEQIESVE